MRRTWMALPALLVLLLAWPLMVAASRHSAAQSGAGTPGRSGGPLTPTVPAASSSANGPADSAAPLTSAQESAAAAVLHASSPAESPYTSRSSTRATRAHTTPADLAGVATTPAAPSRSTASPTVTRTTPPATTPPPATSTRPVTPTPTSRPPTSKPAPKPSTTTPTTSAPKPTTHRPPMPTTQPPTTQPPTNGTITIGNFMYAMPDSVAPGARIAIFNGDSVGHTVTIASAGIDVVVGGGGSAFMTAPSTPGRYVVTCDYHADMTGTLVVS